MIDRLVLHAEILSLTGRQRPPLIDRLVHYAEILSLKGDSYRLKERDLA